MHGPPISSVCWVEGLRRPVRGPVSSCERVNPQTPFPHSPALIRTKCIFIPSGLISGGDNQSQGNDCKLVTEISQLPLSSKSASCQVHSFLSGQVVFMWLSFFKYSLEKEKRKQETDIIIYFSFLQAKISLSPPTKEVQGSKAFPGN